MRNYWLLKNQPLKFNVMPPDPDSFGGGPKVRISKGPFHTEFSLTGLGDLREACGVSVEHTMTDLLVGDLEHWPAGAANRPFGSAYGPKRLQLTDAEKATIYRVVERVKRAGGAGI